MNQSLVPQDDASKKILQRARQEVGVQRMPSMPSLKLCNSKSTVQGVDVGEWYIEESEYIKEKGSREVHITNLGPNPEVLLVKIRTAYSYYKKGLTPQDKGKLVAWTNELDQIDADQKVYVAFNDGYASQVIDVLSKKEFKERKTTAKQKKDNMEDMNRMENLLSNMKFKHAVYVYLPQIDKGLRLFVSLASTTGVKDGEDKTGSFDALLPGSLAEFKNKCKATPPEVLFKNYCKLGSRPKKDAKGEIEYYQMLFEMGNEIEEPLFMKMLQIWNNLTDDLEKRFEADFLSMTGSSVKSDDVIDVDHEELPDL